ncbi:Neurobeachin-like protein 1 [Borealophlyctis nickersoniae]|nr:Neurobeachin-like protein 1 [Borealophlyctis nickersoniae]
MRKAWFFSLLPVLVGKHVLNREHFASVKGPRVVAALLSQNRVGNLSMGVLDAIMSLITASSGDDTLVRDLETSLVFSPRLWPCSPLPVQFEYLQFLLHYIRGHADRFRRQDDVNGGIGFWIQVLDQCYWYILPRGVPADLVARLAGERPQRESVVVLRRGVLEVMRVFLVPGMSGEEAGKVVQALACADETVHAGEVLAFLLGVCRDEGGDGVLEALLQAGLGEVVVDFCGHSEEVIRILAMQFMLAVLKAEKLPDKWKKRMRCEDPSPGAAGVPMGGGPRVLARFLSHHSFTEKTHHALLQLALEDPVLDWDTQEVLLAPAQIRNATLHNPAYLVASVELVQRSSDAAPRLKAQVVQDMLVIVSRDGNAERLRSQTRWQVPLILLVPQGGNIELDFRSAAENGFPAPEDSDTDTRVLFNLILEVLTTVSLDAFSSDRKAWRVVEETTVFAFMCRRGQAAVRVARAFLARLLGVVRREISAGDWREFSAVKMENIWHVLLLAEEFMFHHPDLRDALIREVAAPGTHDPTHPSTLLSLEDLRSAMRDGATGDGVVVRVSYPLGESDELVEECLEVLSSLIDFGVTDITMVDVSEKSHNHPGGLLRMVFRILLSALEMSDDVVWHLALHHLVPLMDKQASALAPPTGNSLMLRYVLGHIHDAYLMTAGVNGENTPVVLDYRVVLPLYMLAVTRWRDAILEFKDVNGKLMFNEEQLQEDLSKQDNFRHLIDSVEWTTLYNQYLIPAMKATEENHFRFVPLITKRYAKVARTTYVRYVREESALHNSGEALDAGLQAAMKKRRDEEISRTSERAAIADIERRMIGRQWATMFRELSRERGLWAPPDGRTASGGMMRWKLDRTENYGRMRRRLTPNWDFDDHRDAAAKRDKAFQPDSNASPKPSRNSSAPGSPATARSSHLKKLKSQLELGLSVPPELIKEVSSSNSLSTGSDVDPEEDWSVLNDAEVAGASVQPPNLSTLTAADGERFVYAADCEMILLMTAVKGRLELTTSHLSFIADVKATTAEMAVAEREAILILLADSDVLLRERRWPLTDLRECYLRRYMLRNSALEFFFLNRTNYLFNFPGSGKAAHKERIRFMNKIVGCKPPNLIWADSRGHGDLLRRSGITEKWQRGEISNFEYLMCLNTISGRTYNDLTQYPVFPWVIQDYESPTLDLSDPSIYRDLSKPIGALDANRLKQVLERYQFFEDPTGRIKKFHYGTHYSSSAAVLFYLLRLEPFTTLHIALQGGKFDHPDRQFHAMQSCWNSVLTGNGDVKELIPEFFYMPEFFVNENEFDLGKKQRGDVLHDVILPRWASSPEEFVRIHREALEGEYVSAHLHGWIDLIWGYKQTGDEAVKAHNVFYYLTYEGAIDIDAISDPVERKSIEDQINNFGQTPSLLFKKPHPKRLPSSQWTRPTIFANPQAHLSYLIQIKTASAVMFIAIGGGEAAAFGPGGSAKSGGTAAATTPPSAAMGAGSGSNSSTSSGFFSSGEKVVTVDGDLCAGSHKWTSASFAVDGQLQFDGDQAPSWKSVDVVYGHHDVVTCVALGEDGRTLVTGSKDTTVMAWTLELQSDKCTVKKIGRKVFCGHDEEVTAVAVNVEHDIVVSGSKDGTVVIHSLHDLRYLRTLRPPPLKPGETLSVRSLLVTKDATLIIYSEAVPATAPPPDPNQEDSDATDNEGEPQAGQHLGTTPSRNRRRSISISTATAAAAAVAGGVSYLHAYTINGKEIRCRSFTNKLSDIKASVDGKFLVAADDKGGISLMLPHNLQISHRFDVSIPVTSIALSDSQQFLFLGRTDGKLLVIGLDAKRIRSNDIQE